MRILLLIIAQWMAIGLFAQQGQDSSVASSKDSSTRLSSDSALTEDDFIIVRKVIMDGDTFFIYEFDEVMLKEFNSPEERERYLKLVRRVKKVLPYAKLAAFRLQMMEDNLNQLKGRRAKKRYIQETEDAIKAEFTEQLKKLHVSEGKLLLKLIHRETGNTVYEILKEFRGNATTFYWGIMAKTYGADIKIEYDPIEDYWIEYIITNLKLE